MQATYRQAMRRVFADEGGYCDDVGDPGGPTKYGITIFDVRKYLKAGATADDVRALTVGQAETIYAAHYAQPLRYDALPPGLDYTVLDYGINSGVSRSAKVLQRLCGVTATGRIDDPTLAAVAKRDPASIIRAMNDERLAFLRSLRTWPRFGGGWGRRVAGVKAASLKMAIAPSMVRPVEIVSPATGKGVAPSPAAATAIKAGSVAAVPAAGYGFSGWIVAHPTLACFAAVGAAVAVIAILAWIEDRHSQKQDAPTPGLMPVPEIIPAALPATP